MSSDQPSSRRLPAKSPRRQEGIVLQEWGMNSGSDMRAAAVAPQTPKILQILQLIWTTHVRWWKWTVPLGLLTSALAGGLLWWTSVPKFTAEAKLQLKEQRPYIAYDQRDSSGVFVSTQLQLFRTRAILSPALEVIAKDVPKVNEMDDPIAWLEESIRAQVIAGSELVSVQFSDPDPETAEKVLDAVVKSYLQYHRKYDRGLTLAVVGVLQDEKDRREKVLTELRNRVRDLSRKAGIAVGGTETGRVVYDSTSPLKAVHDLLIQTEVDLEIHRAELAAAKQRDLTADQNIPEYELERITESQPAIVGLKEEISELSAKLKSWEKTASSPAAMAGYQRLKQQIDAREKSLEQFRKDFRDEAREIIKNQVVADQDQALRDLQAIIDNKQTMRQQLMQRLESEKQVTGASQADLVDLEFARAELERQEEVYDRIGTRIVQLQTEEVAPARIESIDDPKVSVLADKDYLRLPALAAVAALFLPLGLATVWEFLAQRITDSSGIRQQNLEVVGEIAMLPRYLPSDSGGDVNGAKHQLTLFQESVDHLCTAMQLSKDFSDKQVIAIASAVSGEGKTHVAIQLAISLAQSCKEPVLLVETDFRAPNIPELMSISAPVGLLDVLTGRSDLDNAIFPEADKHLDVLACGKQQRHLHAVLDIRMIESIFSTLRSRYRYVVLDTPPVLSAGEAMLFTSQADITLICARRGYSRLSQVREAYARLSKTSSNPVGVILNGTSRHQYLYSYGSYAHHTG